MKIFCALFLVVVSIFTVMGLSACGTSENAVAVVNGVEITEQNIKDRQVYSEIMNEVHRRMFEKSTTIEDAQEQMKIYSLPTDETEILENLIKEELFRQELDDKGVSLEEIHKQATAEYELIKNSESDYFETLRIVLIINKLTEDEFLDLSSLYGYGLYNTNKLRMVYAEGNHDKHSKKDFDEYANDLIDDADIEYTDR